MDFMQIATLSIVAPIGLYVVVRLAAYAFFKSKHQVEKGTHNGS